MKDVFQDSKFGKQSRQSARLEVDIQAKYRLNGTDDFIDCSIVNISSKGMALEVKSILCEGEILEIKLQIEKNLFYVLVMLCGWKAK